MQRWARFRLLCCCLELQWRRSFKLTQIATARFTRCQSAREVVCFLERFRCPIPFQFTSSSSIASSGITWFFHLRLNVATTWGLSFQVHEIFWPRCMDKDSHCSLYKMPFCDDGESDTRCRYSGQGVSCFQVDGTWCQACEKVAISLQLCAAVGLPTFALTEDHKGYER